MAGRIGRSLATIVALLCLCWARAQPGAAGVDFSPTWQVLGPFQVGPREHGADPVERFGGLQSVYVKRPPIESDLVDGGVVAGWRAVNASADGSVRVDWPGVRWEPLVSVFGEAALLFQGWAVGAFSAARAGAFLFRCSGARSFRIDFGEDPFLGDVYSDGTFASRVDLTAGEHTIAVPLGGFAEQSFRCACLGPVEGPLTVLGDILVPSLVGGEPAGALGSFLAANTASGWVRDLTVAVRIPESPEETSTPAASLAPGQLAYLPFAVPPQARGALNVTARGRSGEGQFETLLQVQLQPAGEGAPFLFTFADEDGSVQAAAAVRPSAPCGPRGCPVLLSTHGAGVDAVGQAACYRRRAGAWTLAPTNRNRYGFDWEGPGMRDALRALAELAARTPGVPRPQAASFRADPSRVLFAGHSMGGHGCWELATHHPDLALAAAPAAAWIKMSNYIPPILRAGEAGAEPALRAALDAAAADYDPDLLAPHLAGVPVFARAGGNDDNVSPWHVRRMTRIAREAGADVRYREVPGAGHWWGGVLDDDEIGAFFDERLNSSSTPALPPSFSSLTLNPATTAGKGGVRILQLLVPARLGSVDVTRDGPDWTLATRNVRRLSVRAGGVRVSVDGGGPIAVPPDRDLELVRSGSSGEWSVEPEPARWPLSERSPATSGPLRQVLEGPVLVVAGESGLRAAALLAGRAAAVGRGLAPVVLDGELSEERAAGANLVLVGSPRDNAWTARLMARSPVPVRFDEAGAPCLAAACFGEPGTGVAFLAPWGPRLAAVLAGTDAAGLRKAASLLPLASGERVPDFAVAGPRFGWAGEAGLLAAGCALRPPPPVRS